MTKAKQLLEEFNKYNEEKISNFKENDMVFVCGFSSPSFNCFGTINNIENENKITVDVICLADGRSEISTVADENGQIVVHSEQLEDGKQMLARKIATMESRLAVLQQLQEQV